MALVRCRECGSAISDKADACPTCGAPQAKKRDFISRLARGLLVLFVVVPMLGIFAALILGGGETETASSPPRQSDEATHFARACLEAQRAVKAKLKAPASAKFPGCVLGIGSYEIRTNPERTKFFVKGHVDAQNSFGASLRNQFAVILSRNGESWSADKVAIE